MAAGTRTAPDVTAAASNKRVSIRLIDRTGDRKSISIDVPVAATQIQVEALVAAVQAATQASVWSVEVATIWNGLPAKSNASVGSRDSVYDNVVTLFKAPTPRSAFDWYLPAPDTTVMTAGTDAPDLASVELLAVLNAVVALSPAGYSYVQTRYSEHQEQNKAEKF